MQSNDCLGALKVGILKNRDIEGKILHDREYCDIQGKILHAFVYRCMSMFLFSTVNGSVC